MPIPTAPDAAAPHTAAPAPAAPWAFAVGAVLLLVAIFASGAMALAHLRGLSLPGCGAGSPCASVAASKWGSIPMGDMKWPVSYLGLTYFAAMLVAWLASRGAVGGFVRLIAVLSAVASLMFVGVMLSNETVCKYCLATHVANFGFVGVMFLGGAARLPAMRGLAAIAGTFLLATVTMAGADRALHREAQQQAQSDLDGSIAEIQAKMQRDAERSAAAANPPAPQTQHVSATQPAAAPPQAPAAQPPAPAAQPQQPPVATPSVAASPQPQGFTGRWRFGPERAGVRVVLFTDYGCPDCKKVEDQLERALVEFPNISISVKHFPFASDCNPAAPNLHPNSCWAAKAAEAAGLLGGGTAYHKMHQWLFERKGVFETQAQLEEGIRSAGLDPAAFMPVFMGPQALANIKADIEEAIDLGIAQTPFIFINGVELKGWNATPTAVYDAVAGLAKANPPAAGPEGDRPPRAFAKFLEEWRNAPAMAWPQRAKPYYIGFPGAPVRVTVFGDLQEPNTAQVDKQIRAYIVGRPDITYEFRYFPVDPDCNAGAPRMPGMMGCRAARAAEAAGQLGGDQAYWAVHNWITSNQKTFSEDAMRTLAPQIGLDPEQFMAKMNSPEVSQIIAMDVDIGKRMRITSIPRVHVNGKMVSRWNVPGGGLLETIIEEAGMAPAPAAPQPAAPVDPVQNHPLIKQLQGR